MPWVRIDEHLPDNAKFAELGDYAPLCGWLYITALCYCNRQMTDGLIPKWHITRIANFDHIQMETGGVEGLFGTLEDITPKSLADLLVQAGLWEETGDDHYKIHDYLQYQPSKAQIVAEKAARQASGQAGGQASAQARAQAKSKQILKQNSTPSPSPSPYPGSVTVTGSVKDGGETAVSTPTTKKTGRVKNPKTVVPLSEEFEPLSKLSGFTPGDHTTAEETIRIACSEAGIPVAEIVHAFSADYPDLKPQYGWKDPIRPLAKNIAIQISKYLNKYQRNGGQPQTGPPRDNGYSGLYPGETMIEGETRRNGEAHRLNGLRAERNRIFQETGKDPGRLY